MDGVIRILQTQRSTEELQAALSVIREFKSLESEGEWLGTDFAAWVKLEQLEEYLDHLVNGTPVQPSPPTHPTDTREGEDAASPDADRRDAIPANQPDAFRPGWPSRGELDWVMAHRDELIEKYPKEWIAVSGPLVVAHGFSATELRRQVHLYRGEQPNHDPVFVYYVTTSPAEFVPPALAANPQRG